jgi:hypothetical protein
MSDEVRKATISLQILMSFFPRVAVKCPRFHQETILNVNGPLSPSQTCFVQADLLGCFCSSLTPRPTVCYVRPRTMLRSLGTFAWRHAKRMSSANQHTCTGAQTATGHCGTQPEKLCRTVLCRQQLVTAGHSRRSYVGLC